MWLVCVDVSLRSRCIEPRSKQTNKPEARKTKPTTNGKRKLAHERGGEKELKRTHRAGKQKDERAHTHTNERANERTINKHTKRKKGKKKTHTLLTHFDRSSQTKHKHTHRSKESSQGPLSSTTTTATTTDTMMASEQLVVVPPTAAPRRAVSKASTTSSSSQHLVFPSNSAEAIFNRQLGTLHTLNGDRLRLRCDDDNDDDCYHFMFGYIRVNVEFLDDNKDDNTIVKLSSMIYKLRDSRLAESDVRSIASQAEEHLGGGSVMSVGGNHNRRMKALTEQAIDEIALLDDVSTEVSYLPFDNAIMVDTAVPLSVVANDNDRFCRLLSAHTVSYRQLRTHVVGLVTKQYKAIHRRGKNKKRTSNISSINKNNNNNKSTTRTAGKTSRGGLRFWK